MADTWGLLKRIGTRKYDELKEAFQPKGERIDKDLPLGLRIRGMVDVPEVDFILGGDNLAIKHPGNGNIVSSYGKVFFGNSIIHRFYLQSSENAYMLQIVTDEQKRIEECKLFMQYDELFPEDWDFWLSPHDGYIGYEIFQTKDGTNYYRVWSDPDREIVVQEDDRGNRITRIPPVEFLETVYHDVYGKQTETIKYDSMLYGRHVNENVDEYLLLSAVDEQDGASVQILVGIELEPTSLKII